MSKKKKAIITVATIAVVLACAIYADLFHIYTLRDDNGGTILWNANEAYLFMSVARRGYRLSWPAYVADAIGQLFNAVPSPSDQRFFFIIIHVTPFGINRHLDRVTDDPAGDPHFFTPRGQTIYAFSEGTIYKLSGEHFEAATPEEKAQLGGIEHLASDSEASINGWSVRGIGAVARDAEFSVQIGKETTLRVRQGNVYRSVTDSPIVEILRSGQPPEVLWHINGNPRRVSRREYERAMSALGI
jgi:hypothetical protein